jgi:hypothetical protein
MLAAECACNLIRIRSIREATDEDRVELKAEAFLSAKSAASAMYDELL